MVPESFWTQAIASVRASAPRPLFWLAEGDDDWLGRAGFDASYSWPTYGALKETWATGDPAPFVRAALAEQQRRPPGRRCTSSPTTTRPRGTAPPSICGTGRTGCAPRWRPSYGLGGSVLVYNGQEAAAPQRLNLFEDETIDFVRPRPAPARSGAGPTSEARIRRWCAAGRRRSTFPASIAYTRTLGADRVAILVNPSAERREADLPAEIVGMTDAFGQGRAEARITLAPYGFRVFVGR